MQLKKKTGLIYRSIVNQRIFTRISKRTASIINLIKDRGLEFLFVSILLIYCSGIINALLEGANPIMQNYIIFPQRGAQTLPETFFYLFTMVIGGTGIYLLNKGGHQSLRQRLSDFYIIFGFSSLLLAVALSLYILVVKL